MDEREQILFAITQVESQRALLGDELAQTMLAPLRAKLNALEDTQAEATQIRQATVLFARLNIVQTEGAQIERDSPPLRAGVGPEMRSPGG